MKRVLLALVTALCLLAPAAPVVAQAEEPGCDINLNHLFMTLATAALASDVGNSAGAIEALDAAQEEIAVLRAACAGEPAPEGTRRSGKIVAYAPGNQTSLDKLDALAFANNIPFEVAADSDKGIAEVLTDEDTASVLLMTWLDSESLIKLATFYEEGGTIVMPYARWWTEQNQALQDYFGVSVVEEDVVSSDDGVLHFPDSALPSWLTGLRVSAIVPGIDAYLVAPAAGSEVGTVTSQTGGHDRIVYYESADGRLLFMPTFWNGEDELWQNWFDDDNIDLLDNEKAALALLRRLAEQNVTPTSSEGDAGSERPDSVTDADVATVEQIRAEVESGSIDRKAANESLLEIAARVGRDGFAWLMRRLPVTTDGREWVSLDQYLQQEAVTSGVNPEARLSTDPVGVGVDLMFGEYDSEDILEWTGLGEPVP